MKFRKDIFIKKSKILTLLYVIIFVSNARAVSINEILINAPGADNGKEFIELSGAAGESLNGLSIVLIEGDGNSAGKIDRYHTFDSTDTLGDNGLLLLRDTTAVLNPIPEPATTVIVEPEPQTLFTNDLENGTITFLLVKDFFGALGDDLDTNNDGVLDALLPWTSVIETIAWVDGGANDLAYGSQLGGVDIDPNGFIPDAYVSGMNGNAYVMDVHGAGQGPYTANPNNISNHLGVTVSLDPNFMLTPGGTNRSVIKPSSISEPSALILALIGLAVGFINKAVKICQNYKII